ncbi:hypothetical protein RSAG8_08625, partial [Rhizoctonia solani AG-8 WAC10335]
MTQIRQHFQREERLLDDSKGPKTRVAPVLHFHDMSDVLKSVGKVPVDLRGIKTGSSMLTINAVGLEADNDPTVNGPSAEGDDIDTQGLTGEEWEREAGLGEVIE